jgi:hypothetical protein
MTRVALSLALLLASGAGTAGAMSLTSPDLKPNGWIGKPQMYTRCGGPNVSPALTWSGAPAGAKSLVLTMIDVDAKPAQWSHWIVVDLPPNTAGLPKGATSLPGQASGVAGNFGDETYAGPCPPVGSGVHHYQFTIWAMPQATTKIESNGDASQIAPMLSHSALAHATLTGMARR